MSTDKRKPDTHEEERVNKKQRVKTHSIDIKEYGKIPQEACDGVYVVTNKGKYIGVDSYKEGKQDGWTEFVDSGGYVNITHYRNGLAHGPYIRYNPDPKGTPFIVVGYCENGNQQGPSFVRQEHTPDVSMQEHKNGVEHGRQIRIFDTSVMECVHMENGEKHGSAQKFRNYEESSREYEYKHDVKHGTYYIRDDKDNITEKGRYVNGRLYEVERFQSRMYLFSLGCVMNSYCDYLSTGEYRDPANILYFVNGEMHGYQVQIKEGQRREFYMFEGKESSVQAFVQYKKDMSALLGRLSSSEGVQVFPPHVAQEVVSFLLPAQKQITEIEEMEIA